jgi:hypothetical protein
VPVDVYLRLSDVASCGTSSCTFTFEKPKAKVTAISQAYDQTVAYQNVEGEDGDYYPFQQVITLKGSGFTAGEKKPSMNIDGVKLKLLSVEDDVAKFELGEVKNTYTNNIWM